MIIGLIFPLNGIINRILCLYEPKNMFKSNNGSWAKWKKYAHFKIKKLLTLSMSIKQQFNLAQKNHPKTWQAVKFGIRLIIIFRNLE